MPFANAGAIDSNGFPMVTMRMEKLGLLIGCGNGIYYINVQKL